LADHQRRMNIAFLFDLIHPRRTVLKRQEIWRRRASAGITASIAKLSESVGMFESPGRTIPEVVEASQHRQIPSVRPGLMVLTKIPEIPAGCGIDLTAGRLTAITFSTRAYLAGRLALPPLFERLGKQALRQTPSLQRSRREFRELVTDLYFPTRRYANHNSCR
jgi:hypothetical protein